MALALQAKEEMDKVKSRALTETDAINTELQYTVAFVRRTDKGQRRPIKSLKNEAKILKIGIIDAPNMEQW